MTTTMKDLPKEEALRKARERLKVAKEEIGRMAKLGEADALMAWRLERDRLEDWITELED